MEPYELLEKELAEWSGMPYVVACSSGTAALHLALEVLQLSPGSKVIVPDFTMIACPRAVTLAGLEPVFVDCNDDLNLCRFSVKDAIKDQAGKIVAAMVVHVYGRESSVTELLEDGEGSHIFPVIEDLAEAHGVKPHPSTDAACWSFYKNKIIAGEEGGAVGFRDEKLAKRARQLRSLGFTDDHDFVHVPRGHNYRLSNANAELIRGSLGLIEGKMKWRRLGESWYDELCLDEWRMPPRDAAWVYDIRVPGMMPLRQTELVRALQAEGIAARHAFKPCHTQEEYRHCPVYGNGNAAVASREVIYLPLYPGKVTKESCERAFKVIKKVVGDWTTMK